MGACGLHARGLAAVGIHTIKVSGAGFEGARDDLTVRMRTPPGLRRLRPRDRQHGCSG